MLTPDLFDLLDESVEVELLGLPLEPLQVHDDPVVSLVGFLGDSPLQGLRSSIVRPASILSHGVRLKGQFNNRRTLVGSR